MKEAEGRGFTMAFGTGEMQKNALTTAGLLPQHSYCVLSLHEIIDKEGKTQNLCHIRNPWSTDSWNGDYGD